MAELQNLLAASVLIAALGSGVSAQSPQEKSALELLEKGRVEQAQQLLLEALKQDPKSQSINTLLGQIAFSRKDYIQAVARFQKAPAFLANNPLLLVNFAEALLETKAPEAARSALGKLPARDPVAQFEAGLLLARFEQFAPAEEHFELAKSGYPEPRVLAYNLALTQYRGGKFAKSAATLEGLRKQTPQDADVLNLLGQAYVDAGEVEKAQATLKEAIKFHPRDERNYLALAKLAMDAELEATGIEALNLGIEQLPESYTLRIQRGFLRLSNGLYPDAEADYRRAIEIQPGSASPKIGLAFVLLRDKREDEAAKILENVLTSNQNFFVHYLLGELCAREERNDEAVDHLRKAAQIEPNFSPTHTNLGKLYLKRNEVAAAVKELELAVSLDAEDLTAFYQLSMAYRRSGEREKAQKALAQVKELNKEQREIGMTRFLTRRLRKLRTSEASPF